MGTSRPTSTETPTESSSDSSNPISDVVGILEAAAWIASLGDADHDPHGGPPRELRSRVWSDTAVFRLGGQVDALLGDGVGGDLYLGFEVWRLGVEGRLTGLSVTPAGTSKMEEFSLQTLHLSWALWRSAFARLRIESGLSRAVAPGLTQWGPSLALSFQACAVDRVDVEARVQATPLPFQQLDAQAGVALHAGIVQLRVGLRGLVLKDVGRVPGAASSDGHVGPYFGLGLLF
ncbi:hypothetical protein [Pyxidicoccus caerfyrddinensis]|uniref:hypothetical protein n=1 Tax=Pyxidicoccus caerfyrddinensis TaxID=2709663 RepID=UPI0013DA2147|nr:hypothetical protein [Pyxidicoccus caerfyrddinensis]